MSPMAPPAFRIPDWNEIVGERPDRLRRLLSVWPPFRFAGIRVVRIESDWSGATVRLRLGLLSRNYVGTQFGGSLFAMTDPFWMILLMHRLGSDYVVWDKRAEIEYVRPGRTDVQTEFVVDPAVVEELRSAADAGERVLRWFENDIVDTSGQLVARVRRQVHVRRRG